MLNLLISKLDNMGLKYDNEKLSEMAHGHNAPLKATLETSQTKSGICFETRPLVCEIAEQLKLRNELFFIKFLSRDGTYVYRHAMSVAYDPSLMRWAAVEFNGLRNFWIPVMESKSCEGVLDIFAKENKVIMIKHIDPRMLNQQQTDLYTYFQKMTA